MLKSEAETMVRRVLEDTKSEMTDEQITTIAQIVVKICGRMIEEALASWRPGTPGSRPSFFMD